MYLCPGTVAGACKANSEYWLNEGFTQQPYRWRYTDLKRTHRKETNAPLLWLPWLSPRASSSPWLPLCQHSSALALGPWDLRLPARQHLTPPLQAASYPRLRPGSRSWESGTTLLIKNTNKWVSNTCSAKRPLRSLIQPSCFRQGK